VDEAERKPKEELDEEKLVATVRPLIEEGGKLLQEANGAIRALDPDRKISNRAEQRSANHEATPEEYHLAELLKKVGRPSHKPGRPVVQANPVQVGRRRHANRGKREDENRRDAACKERAQSSLGSAGRYAHIIPCCKRMIS
jgi:hypothetical protein